MIRSVIALLVLLLSSVTVAGKPLDLKIGLDAADLEAGAKYEYEVRAYYVFVPTRGGRMDAAGLEDGIAAPEVYRASFVAPLKKVPAQVTFHFADNPPPPTGMMAAVAFKTSITITPPAASKRAPIKRERIYAGPDPTQPMPSQCVRLRGPVASGSFYLGVSDCTEPIMAMPKPAPRK